jgi:acyl-CoA thioester hydrolase
MTTATTRDGLLLSREVAVENDWVDYNGHLNQAFYAVIFDRSIDEALMPLGLGPDYIKARNCSYMTVESHTCFIREVLQTDPVVVTSRILDLDDKRMHMFCEMRHARDDWLAATVEYMFLHVDMSVRRTAPWPADLRDRLASAMAATSHLPWPERAGRRIAIPRKG